MSIIAKPAPGYKSVIAKLDTINGRKTACFYSVTGFDVTALEYIATASHDPSADPVRFGISDLQPDDKGEWNTVLCATAGLAWQLAADAGYRPATVATSESRHTTRAN
ncbi:hypothetical protein [Agrobacterium fabrum]|uniref:hypothetical protein n=1 Tax=Agrobacterium fabrum TaxID=1176649 RepID=UPI002157252C|nr:hypothetical protein [Agrobacterium fabrum]MCR6722803.1 hypothetical protein [Agrobacterium fabrum]